MIGPIDEALRKPTRRLNAKLLHQLDEEAFAELRRRLRDRARANGQDGAAHHDLDRRLVKLYRAKKFRPQVSKRLLAWQRRDSILLDALAPHRGKSWTPPLRRRKRDKFSLKEFSFLDAPAATMELLAKIASAEATLLGAEVDFVDDMVLDIGPYLVWGLMCRQMAPFMSGGRIRAPIQRVLKAVDLLHYMGIKVTSKKAGQRTDLDIHSFPVRQRREAGSTKNFDLLKSVPTFSKVSDDLVETVDEWLGAIDEPLELAPAGKAWLNCLVTEILNNAERHSHIEGDGDWVVAGFMARRNGSQGAPDSFVCHFSFVSIGLTISESIATTQDERVRNALNLCRERRGKDIKGDEATEEQIGTLLALQDGISRLPQGDGDSRGGVGMMDMVDFAAQLGQTKDPGKQHVVVIISGSSVIRFHGAYGQGVPCEGSRRLQWFNSQNSLDDPPDSNYVFQLKHRFPGTIITMRFCLDGAVLTEKLNGDHTN